ncbi:MAG TPA: glycosyltransferase family 4 protein [Woeseiaceae bacterium]|nr:glycosyltransferase family 4 protein [Woeseiaceae bacterium]
MKILHVETGRHFYGGPQQVVYLVAALQQLGHENTVVCPPGSGADSAARAKGIRVQNLFCAGDLDLPFAYRLTQYINETKPDLVHCHSRRGADVLGGLAASFADVPAVVTRRVDNTEMQLIATLRYRPFKKIIAISDAIAEVLRGLGVDDSRLAVIRSAVDAGAFASAPDRAAFQKQFAVPEGTFVMAAAGQLIARKGHRFLLDALGKLRAEGRPIRLILFGEGELEAALRAQAADLKLGEAVQFAGYRDDLDTYVGCFDLFAHPSLAEGLGVATLKAQAAGVPVVGFAAGGVSEAVEDGATGLLVAPEDTAALAAAIARLMDDDARRGQMGAAGRVRMREEFSIEVMTRRHIELYDSVISN